MLLVEHVTFSYPPGVPALADVSFSMREGERVGLVGANGAGKSTLLALLCGLHLPADGKIVIEGTALAKATLQGVRAQVGMIFQNPDDQLFMASVFDDVAFGLRARQEPEEAVYHRVMHTLEHLGIAALADRPPYRLSGGEKRSAAIASVVAMQPKYMLYDEPTAFLDRRAKQKLMDIVTAITAGQLIASHDFELIEAVCDRVLVLAEGRLIADGDPRALLGDEALLKRAGLYLGGTPFMHEHDGHEHSHGVQSREETIAALRYMLRHNEHHAGELRELAHELTHLGASAQAEEVLRGLEDYGAGNAKLKNALEALGG